jgi:hypothetical protein
MRYVVATIAVLLASMPAEAAVVTRAFRVTASTFANFDNAPAPFASVVATFQVTYDDDRNSAVISPDLFSTVTDGRSNSGPFSAVPVFRYFLANAVSTMPRLIIGGEINGVNVLTNRTNDFYIAFDASPVLNGFAMMGFTTETDRVSFTATNASIVELPVATAVPEPSAWAMMILGLGAVAQSLRRRASRVVGNAAG